MGSGSVSGYAVSEDLSPYLRNGSGLEEANFRFARQPPTIVTWAELDFYDLPLIRPSGFVSSGRQGFSNQELGELRMDRRAYGNSSEAIPFLLSHRIDMLSRSKRRGVKTLEIELVQAKELAYELSGSRTPG
jgi:hypothetical protein